MEEIGTSARGLETRQPVRRTPKSATTIDTFRVAGVDVTRMTGPAEDVIERMKPHVGNPQAILALGISRDGSRLDISIITDRFPGMPGGKVTREMPFTDESLSPLFSDGFVYTGLVARLELGLTISRVVTKTADDPIFSGMAAVADGLFPKGEVGSTQPATPAGACMTGGFRIFDGHFGKKRFVSILPSSFDPAVSARLISLGSRHCLELSSDGTQVRVAPLIHLAETLQSTQSIRKAAWAGNPVLTLPAPASAISQGYTDHGNCQFAVATLEDGRYVGLQLVALSKDDRRLKRLVVAKPLSVAKPKPQADVGLGDLLAFGPHSGLFRRSGVRRHVPGLGLPSIVLDIVSDTAK